MRHDRTQPSRPHNPLADFISTALVGSPLLRPRRFTTALVHIQKTPHVSSLTRTSHSVPLLPAHPRPYLSTPTQLEECGLPREKFLSPPFGCLSGGFLWPGPIDRVRVPPRRAALLRHSWRFVDLYYIFRPSSVPHRYLKANILRRDLHLDFLLFINGRHIFLQTGFYSDFVAASFSGS